jgi:aminopeptidase YwaD
MAHVRRLAGREGVRVRATPAERRAAHYAASTFRSLGYDVRIQRFSVDGRRSRNIVAWWPGAERYPLVIGGHIDTVPGAPGANDNASGVAVVIEIARLIAGRPQARWVRFVAFGSEEYGIDGRHHVGSQTFVRRLGRAGRRRLAGTVSVDMVADGRPLIVGTAGIGRKLVARALLRRMRRAHIRATYRTTCDCSDNGPFERAGIPAAFLWSGPDADYHSPSDVVANMRPHDLVRSGRAMRAFVRALDKHFIARLRHGG